MSDRQLRGNLRNLASNLTEIYNDDNNHIKSRVGRNLTFFTENDKLAVKVSKTGTLYITPSTAGINFFKKDGNVPSFIAGDTYWRARKAVIQCLQKLDPDQWEFENWHVAIKALQDPGGGGDAMEIDASFIDLCRPAISPPPARRPTRRGPGSAAQRAPPSRPTLWSCPAAAL